METCSNAGIEMSARDGVGMSTLYKNMLAKQDVAY